MVVWSDYVVIFTSVDWYTYYNGAAKVAARTDTEAIRKARKKLEIPDYYTNVTCEDLFKFPRK